MSSSKYNYLPADAEQGRAKGSSSHYHQKLETQRSTGTGFRDPFFLLLFVVHFIAIVAIAFSIGIPAFKDDTADVDNSGSSDIAIDSTMAKKLGYALAGMAGLTLVSTALLLSFIIANAEKMIRFVLNLNVLLSFVFAGLAFYYNVLWMGVLLLFIALLNLCYLRAVQSRIPFASANLKVASAAIKDNWSVVLVSYVVVLQSVVWSGIWVAASYGVYDYGSNNDDTTASDDGTTTEGDVGGSTGMMLFLLLLSFYWTHEVLRNISHVTTAGVVASFWYEPDRSSIVSGAYCRACSTSLGSIAFGSLIVAFLQTLKAMAEQAERKGSSAACLARCILQCFENLMKYFNRWAFVYVGIYGDSFIQSGKAVMTLFKNRGVTTIVNDNLIQSTLSFLALMVGCIMAGFGAIIPSISGSTFDTLDSAVYILAVMGFLLGIFMTSIMTSVIDSGVATVFVCFSEGGDVLEQTHPSLFYELSSAWREMGYRC